MFAGNISTFTPPISLCWFSFALWIALGFCLHNSDVPCNLPNWMRFNKRFDDKFAFRSSLSLVAFFPRFRTVRFVWVGLALDTGWLLKVPDLLPSRLSRTKGDLFYSVNTISLSCSFATLISNFGRFAVMARIFSFSILLIHTNVFIFILRLVYWPLNGCERKRISQFKHTAIALYQ